jgi:hypothetical protein
MSNYLLATSAVCKGALFYLCFEEKNNAIFDKRDHSQRIIQGYGIQHKKISLGKTTKLT